LIPSPARLRAHLLEELLPLWNTRGWDARHGGFHSRLDHELAPVRDPYKRLLVQARQLFVFSSASLAGAPPWASERAHATFDHLRRVHWDPRFGGWYFTATPEGAPLDRRKDTYAHAFVLLALAAYAGVDPSGPALELAHATTDLLERHLADAKAGGFHEAAREDWEPLVETRRHNPHMHLLEGFLALVERTGAERFRDHARRLIELFARCQFDAARGCLPENFAADWTPLGGADAWTEPGHHYEWIWLLAWARRCGIDAAPRELDVALERFANQHGLDPQDGAVFDRLHLDGRVLDHRKRVWPQTEHIRALTLRAAEDPRTRGEIERRIEQCFERYVDPGHGGWREHAARDGEIMIAAMNATTVYHVWTALHEACGASAH
jgi:mannose/cellobiose epimerase-like protein (N-acyl-D-glucosamine 2-epimerase family)